MKLDDRVRELIEKTTKEGKHRSILVIVGESGRQQVPILHQIMTKSVVKRQSSVLWCFKKDLGFTTNKRKKMKEIKKTKGRHDVSSSGEEPFDRFILGTPIRYCYYKDTFKILGNTFGVLVLQDFEAITPNILARTIETVQGGGLVLLLLSQLQDLKQLREISMDAHSKLLTEGFRSTSDGKVVPRFNNRFLLSLSHCDNCLVLDDSLSVLPLHNVSWEMPPRIQDNFPAFDQELDSLKKAHGPLVGQCRTLDQARAVMLFLEAISDKSPSGVVSLTASRGRGKSAALGLAIASAISIGYSNVFVSSPSPENLKTLFVFLCKGFDALGYKEHMDYELVQSSNPDYHQAVVRVNVFKNHRQTVAYIEPCDYKVLAQAELVVIDEAAAIPLPIVKRLLGPYLVFVSSTVNGYEGTGRALSLKLFSELRAKKGTKLREITLKHPIRYSIGDPIEQWLNALLCLDASPPLISGSKSKKTSLGCPSPDSTELYMVSRDALFSYQPAAEEFLQQLVGLFAASHYRNSPDDLLLLADAPHHLVFVLLNPNQPGSKTTPESAGNSTDLKFSYLPEILCVVQVSLEGGISQESAALSLARGSSPAGDLIPWTISHQFRDPLFPRLSGVRIVRIAAHPDLQRMGYGTRAISLLVDYYSGKLASIEEPLSKQESTNGKDSRPASLLLSLDERSPEFVHWVGVSFGVTSSLLSFWHKCAFEAVYLRHAPNELTGEHTTIMFKPVEATPPSSSTFTCSPGWETSYRTDFERRFVNLLSSCFRDIPSTLGLKILQGSKGWVWASPTQSGGVDANDLTIDNNEKLSRHFSVHDIMRLEGYANNLVDYRIVMDLVPALARLYFTGQIPRHIVRLSPAQRVILLAFGLQQHTLDHVSAELNVADCNHSLAMFNKAIRKIFQHFKNIQTKELSDKIPSFSPLDQPLEEDLQSAADAVPKPFLGAEAGKLKRSENPSKKRKKKRRTDQTATKIKRKRESRE